MEIATAALSCICCIIYFNATYTKSLWLFVNIFLNDGIGVFGSIWSVASSYSKLNFLPTNAGYYNYVSAIDKVSIARYYVEIISFHTTAFFYLAF